MKAVERTRAKFRICVRDCRGEAEREENIVACVVWGVRGRWDGMEVRVGGR